MLLLLVIFTVLFVHNEFEIVLEMLIVPLVNCKVTHAFYNLAVFGFSVNRTNKDNFGLDCDVTVEGETACKIQKCE